MASETVKIHGLRELEKTLKELPARIEMNVMRGGVRAGARVFANAAKSNVNNVTGTLRKSIKVSARLDRRHSEVVAKVIAGTYYAHMVEFGTKAHGIKPKNRRALAFNGPDGPVVAAAEHPGAQAKPFMRPAFDEHMDAAIAAFRKYAETRLAKEAAKK